jgi:hypothetical protein
MRVIALAVALCVTTSLSACAQPSPGYGQSGPPPGYGQDGSPQGYSQGAPPPGYGQGSPPPGYGQGAPQTYGQQGWAGGMQSANGQMQPPPAGISPDQQPPGPPGLARPHMDMAARFAAANTTRDGLTGISRHFQQIDVDHKGYVTMQDVHAWRHAKHGQRMEREEAPPPPGNAYPPPLPPQAPPQPGQQY